MQAADPRRVPTAVRSAATATRRRLLAWIGLLPLSACRPGAPTDGVGASRGARPDGPQGPLLVTSVADGDSFEVRDASGRQWRIRMAGIDAPERSQPYGRWAGKRLAELLGDGSRLEISALKNDVYGRVVADVSVAGRDIGQAMLSAGAAWHFRRYANEQPADQRRRYADAERDARAARIGLWRDSRPEPPWDYRTRRRRTDS